MARFPCPYCRQSLNAQPSRAGLRRRCPRCHGPFREPETARRGQPPEKWDDTDGTSNSEPANFQPEPTAADTAADIAADKEHVSPAPPGSDAGPPEDSPLASPHSSTTQLPQPTPAKPPLTLKRTHPADHELAAFDTRTLLEPLEALGLRGVLLTWSPHDAASLKLGTSSGCPKSESEQMLLKVALKWIKTRSPKLHAKLVRELAKLEDPSAD